MYRLKVTSVFLCRLLSFICCNKISASQAMQDATCSTNQFKCTGTTQIHPTPLQHDITGMHTIFPMIWCQQSLPDRSTSSVVPVVHCRKHFKATGTTL